MDVWAAAPYVNVNLASVSAALGDPGPDEVLVIAAILDETLAAWVEDAVDSDHLLPPAKRARDGKLTARNFQLGLRKGTLAHLCAACPPVAAVCDSFLDASTSKVLEGDDLEQSASLSSSGALAAASSPSAALSPSSRRRGSASVSPQWSRRREDNPIGERDVLAVVKRVNPALALSNDAQLLCMAVAREMLRHAVAMKAGGGAPPVPPSPLAAVAGATASAASSPRSGASGSSSDGRVSAASAPTGVASGTAAATGATAATIGSSSSPSSVFASLFPWCPPAVVTRAAQLAHLLINVHAGTWAPPPATTVRVKVIRPGGWSVSHSTTIGVPFHDPLNAHLDAACRTMHLARKPFVFLHGWALVEPTDTPAALHMTDKATIWGVDAKWWDNARRGEARRGALTGTAASASAAAETHVRSIRSKASSKVADDIRQHAVVLHTIAEKRERSLSPGAVAGAPGSGSVAGAASPTAATRSSAAEAGDAAAAATPQAVGRAGMRRPRGVAAAAAAGGAGGGADAAATGAASGTFMTAGSAPASSRGTGTSASPPPSRSHHKADHGAASASPTHSTPTKTTPTAATPTTAASGEKQPSTAARTPVGQARLRGPRGDRTPSPAAAEPAAASPADALPIIRTGGYHRINRSQASRLPMLPSEKLGGLVDASPATGGIGAGTSGDSGPACGSKMPPRRLLVTPLVGTRNASSTSSTAPGSAAADSSGDAAAASAGLGPQSPSPAAIDFSRLERLPNPSSLPDFGKRFQSAPAPTTLPPMPEPLPVAAAAVAAASPPGPVAGSPTHVSRRAGGTRVAATTPTAVAVADGRKSLRPPRGGAGAETPAANVAARSPASGPGRRALNKSSSVTDGSSPATGVTGSPVPQRRFSAGPVTLGQVRIPAPAAEKLFSKTQATLQPLESALGSLAALNQAMLAASSASAAPASPPGRAVGAAVGSLPPLGDSENAPAATTPATAVAAGAGGASGVEIDWKQLRVVLRQTQDATAALLSALDSVPDATAAAGVRTGRSPAGRGKAPSARA